MGVHQVKAVVVERQLLAVGDLETAVQPLLFEIGTGQGDGRRGEVDAGHLGAALRESREVDAGAAADLENRPAAWAVKRHEPEQVVELLEMIPIEVVEEAARTDRMRRDVEIVDVSLPVLADLRGRRHANHYNSAFQLSAVSSRSSAKPPSAES